MPRKSPLPLPRLSPADYAAEVATANNPAGKAAPAAPAVTRDAPTSVACPTCGKPMKLRPGKWGQFYGCTGFPTCRQTLNPSKVHGALLTAPSSSSEKKAPATPWTPPKGSEEQEAIWAEIVNGSTHMMVEAFAGTGKSYTCRHGMHFAKRANPALRIAYFAFSREIVAEFRHDAPEGVYVGTLNAAGYGVCKRALKCGDPNPDKVGDIVEELLGPGVKWNELRAIKSGVEALVSLCQGNLLEGSPADLDALAAKYDVSIESTHRAKVYDLVPRVLALCEERTTIVSYEDQIWLPVVLGLPCTKYDLIFVDEAQDLNPCQHQLVSRMLAPKGRVVMVGDPNQAIFGFRGSDVASMANFANLLGDVKPFSLSVTRRCPKSVVSEAQSYVPGIRALDDAPEGTVRRSNYDKGLAELSAGDMVLCRVNAPLVSIAYKLLREKRKAVIRGRDIGGQLLALINRLDAQSVPSLIQKAYDWHSKESAKLDARKKNSEAQQQALSDKLACLLAICEGADNLSEVKQTVETLFANFDASGRPKDAVILSSIHRAKGLEAPRVFWYDPSIRCRATQDWQQRQESNLGYVAVTRAKAELVYVSPPAK